MFYEFARLTFILKSYPTTKLEPMSVCYRITHICGIRVGDHRVRNLKIYERIIYLEWKYLRVYKNDLIALFRWNLISIYPAICVISSADRWPNSARNYSGIRINIRDLTNPPTLGTCSSWLWFLHVPKYCPGPWSPFSYENRPPRFA